MENSGGTGGRKPPTSAELAAWRADDMARRANRGIHQRGAQPIHGHVSLEQADAEDRKRARDKSNYVGNDPRKMPDVGDLHGRRPQRPDRSSR